MIAPEDTTLNGSGRHGSRGGLCALRWPTDRCATQRAEEVNARTRPRSGRRLTATGPPAGSARYQQMNHTNNATRRATCAVEPVPTGRVCVMAQYGAPRGKPQRGNYPSYVVGSGVSYRPGVNLPPSEADKIVTAALAMDCSVSGLLQQLVARMVVDEHGVPAWYEPPDQLDDRMTA